MCGREGGIVDHCMQSCTHIVGTRARIMILRDLCKGCYGGARAMWRQGYDARGYGYGARAVARGL